MLHSAFPRTPLLHHPDHIAQCNRSCLSVIVEHQRHIALVPSPGLKPKRTISSNSASETALKRRIVPPRRDVLAHLARADHETHRVGGSVPSVSIAHKGRIYHRPHTFFSHNETENTRPEEVTARARVLAACVMALANR